jgi:hypothetical protein
MPHLVTYSDQENENLDSKSTVVIDPKNFFTYASSGADRWQELIGLNISHCTFGLGTIKKIEGEYIYVDLPERQGKKHLTEFGLDSFLRGFFSNLVVDNTLQQKMIAAAEASLALAAEQAAAEAEALKAPPKKKRKVTTKAPKKVTKATKAVDTKLDEATS